MLRSSQRLPPVGYEPNVYGPWPSEGGWIVLVRVPPSWRSSRDPTNFHTVAIFLADEHDPNLNPLMMGEGLEQVTDWVCTCKAGLRTCASCTHRLGVLILLCATECFNSAKIPEALLVDTAR